MMKSFVCTAYKKLLFLKKPLVCVVEVRQAARVLRAVNHGLRGQIMLLLSRTEKLTVTEIHKALDIEQAVASLHLGILREAKVVGVDRANKNRFYYLNRNRLQEINAFSKALISKND
jgi:DNA-binding transcriptional ArsR family regulator